MMGRLMSRGEALARDARRRCAQRVASRLRALFGSAAVETEEARVSLRGKGLTRRWLTDARLRLIGGGSR